MQLNHCSNRVTKGSLDLVITLFEEELGFRVLRKTPTSVWMRQGETLVDLQFKETDAQPVGHDKHNSHVAFLSPTPREDLEALGAWLHRQGRRFRIGSWSDKEFYLDAPDMFVDFAIEAMKPELSHYDEIPKKTA